MHIAAVTMAVPPRIQSAQELAPLIGRSEEWIQQHTGVLRRRIAKDNVSPAQLATAAARQAISVAGQPDLILYAGALTQQLVPDTSAFVQSELELERVPCFTINQTCLSFIGCQATQLGTRPLGVVVLGTPLVLYRSSGSVVVAEDRCPHRNAPLLLAEWLVDSIVAVHGGKAVLPKSSSSGSQNTEFATMERRAFWKTSLY